MNREPIAGIGDRKVAIIHETSPIGDGGTLSLMLLRLGTRWFALDVHAIVEVALKGAVMRVPTAPSHILGVTCLAGRLVTVVSLEQMIGGEGLLSRESCTTLPRLVVVRHGEYEMAVVAEGIHGLAEHVSGHGGLTDEEPAPGLPDFVREEFPWQGHRVALLDVPRLVAMAARLAGVDSPSEPAEA
jgi:chemotaxis signal transduction protein